MHFQLPMSCGSAAKIEFGAAPLLLLLPSSLMQAVVLPSSPTTALMYNTIHEHEVKPAALSLRSKQTNCYAGISSTLGNRFDGTYCEPALSLSLSVSCSFAQLSSQHAKAQHSVQQSTLETSLRRDCVVPKTQWQLRKPTSPSDGPNKRLDTSLINGRRVVCVLDSVT